ncbi:helix-turn-helix transcriptional regulator [Corynebacterium tapiri]|uniref:WYL domain-containing protein n=1 Tax=Corynebacterium tapiri TaxID=1448266 RepID=A0A5C4U4M8_9CORY|nr:WYL domain-containing protein [Corynebacterium tapiri]TNL97615.1 WYL domain-containing protein [Corynebacterium tapiri]
MTDRRADLVRALNLIPYFRSHPDHTLLEAATNLGMDHKQMVRDLQRLHTSGVGTHTEELIDLTFNANRTSVEITEDQGLTKPLRLTQVEAAALLLSLEQLAPYVDDRAAVDSAAQTLRTLLGGAARGVVTSEVGEGGEATVSDQSTTAQVRTVNTALLTKRRLKIAYYSESSGSVTERTIDPVRLFFASGFSYLLAWDLERDDHRTFRLDRIQEAVLLDDKVSRHPAPKKPSGVKGENGPFSFHNQAEVEVARTATWLADYHPITLHSADDDPAAPMVPGTLSYGSDEWLVRFCLSNADRLRLVSPTSLAQEVSRRAKERLSRYAESISEQR